MSNFKLPVRRLRDVTRIGDKAVTEVLELTGEERARVIEAYDLVDLDAFTVDYELKPWRKSGVMVKGRLRAQPVQRCVMTLDPVTQTIDETFQVRFLPEEEAERAAPRVEDAEIDIEFESDDPPEPLEDGQVDLGAVACEQFALMLDPFPKAAGADDGDAVVATTSDTPDEEDERPSPFAVLRNLKTPPDGGGNA